jgi:molybdenum cofactor cytidylyltransferase
MTTHKIALIILAAGESSRMRLPKQLLPYKSKSMLQHTVDEAVASKAHSVYTVLGANADQIAAKLRTLRIQVITNPDWEEGIGSSIRAGVAALPDEVDGAIISLCDQPMIRSTIYNDLIDAHLFSRKPIVACEYENTRGVPALFAKPLFPDLTSLRGHQGAKTIILKDAGAVTAIPFEGGNVDIDTPEDYRKLIEREFKR